VTEAQAEHQHGTDANARGYVQITTETKKLIDLLCFASEFYLPGSETTVKEAPQ